MSIPPILDLSRVRGAYEISDAESFYDGARACSPRKGSLPARASGTLIAAALRYCREQTAPKRVVTLVCDSGNKYLNKLYNDYWMFDQGLLDRPRQGNLLDLIVRRYQEGGAVTLRPTDTLLLAYRRMKLFDVSQIPVMDGERVVGIVDESDLVHASAYRSETIPGSGEHGDGAQCRDHRARCADRRSAADLPARSRGDRCRAAAGSSA